jgi:hypothetical protein
MRRTALALALFALPLCSAFAADAPPKPDLYVVHEEVVPPAMMGRYEGVTKEMLGMLAEKNVTNPSIAFTTFMTTDMHYVYVSRLPGGFSGLDAMYTAWMSLPDTLGKEKFKDLETRGAATMSSYNEMIIMRRADLSYEPATPRIKPEEHRFYRWDFYYLQPGKESEAEAIAKDYVALFKSKNVGDGFTIFMATMGQDLPLLIAAIPSKSPADFAAVDEKTNATLGADLRALQARALGITRRLEHREGWVRPDLSYPAPAKPAAK